MKTLKKMSALLMALVMMLSLCTTVFAANATADTPGEISVDTNNVVTNTATVTITGIPASASVTFSTYQVLYATYDSTSNSLEFHLTDWAKAALVDTALTVNMSTQFMSEDDAIEALSGITAIGSSPATATTGQSATEQSVLVNYLASYAAANRVTPYSATWDTAAVLSGATTTSATTDLPVGAYLVLPASDTMAFLNMMVSVDVSATSDTAKDGWKLTANNAILKGSELNIDKTVSDGTLSSDMVADGDTAQAQVGDTLYYSITVDVPKFAANSTNIVFKVTDNPTNLSIDLTTVVVTPYDSNDVAGSVLTAYSEDTTSAANTVYDYKATLVGGVLTVDFSDNYLNTFYISGTGAYPYSYVVITYEAELLSSALVTDGNSNTATLTYGNNTNGTNTAEDNTTVYTYQLELTKLGENSAVLADASFKIYTLNGSTKNYLTFILNTTDGTYEVADSTDTASGSSATTYDQITTGSDGSVTLKGLDGSVTYYIEESVAPSGYTKNTNYLAFTITGATDTQTGDLTGLIDSVSAYEYESGNSTPIETYPDTDSSGNGCWSIKVKQENSANTASLSLTVTDTKIISLPSTGGVGTIMFTILGCVIMITAAALYLGYRRKIRSQQTAE